ARRLPGAPGLTRKRMRTADGSSSPRLGTVTGGATPRAYPTRTTVPFDGGTGGHSDGGASRPRARPAALRADVARSPLRGAHGGAVHARPDRWLLPPRDRRGGC